jgi:hypothetical protein
LSATDIELFLASRNNLNVQPKTTREVWLVPEVVAEHGRFFDLWVTEIDLFPAGTQQF